MAHQARVEELSDTDSDPADMDPSDFDPSQTLMAPINVPTSSSQHLRQQQQHPASVGPASSSASSLSADPERSKHWQCLYPVYFDRTRSRAEGRRVGKEQAVENPLAREIVDAVQALGLHVVFEPGKIHPKDWSNPGRVRILLKENGRRVAGNVKNKHHLYILVAAYLQAHPANEKSPLRLRIAGMPPPPDPYQPPAVPRGWKMNTILPLHSPAVTGGGVSENFIKDMMAGMQGDAGGGAAGGSASEGKKKKDKKKGKA